MNNTRPGGVIPACGRWTFYFFRLGDRTQSVCLYATANEAKQAMRAEVKRTKRTEMALDILRRIQE